LVPHPCVEFSGLFLELQRERERERERERWRERERERGCVCVCVWVCEREREGFGGPFRVFSDVHTRREKRARESERES
jgi:hypothetical protein